MYCVLELYGLYSKGLMQLAFTVSLLNTSWNRRVFICSMILYVLTIWLESILYKHEHNAISNQLKKKPLQKSHKTLVKSLVNDISYYTHIDDIQNVKVVITGQYNVLNWLVVLYQFFASCPSSIIYSMYLFLRKTANRTMYCDDIFASR